MRVWHPSHMATNEERELERYRAVSGRDPVRLPDDHPDAWQWAYRGTPTEREALLEHLQVKGEVEPVALEQGALFAI